MRGSSRAARERNDKREVRKRGGGEREGGGIGQNNKRRYESERE